MATPAYCFTTVKINLNEKPEEITIRCNGKITAESAYMFQREVHEHCLPQPRGKDLSMLKRIVLDLSNVTRIDHTGLKALLDVCTDGERKHCKVEVINFSPRAFRLASLARLNHAFTRILAAI